MVNRRKKPQQDDLSKLITEEVYKDYYEFPNGYSYMFEGDRIRVINGVKYINGISERRLNGR